MPVSEEEMISKTIAKFEDDGYKIESKDDELIGTNEDEKIIIRVVTGERSVGVAVARELRKRIEEEDATEGHIVSDAPLTPYARKLVAKENIRYLSMQNVLIDLFEHELVPEQTVLSEEERDQLLKDLQIEPSQLPKVRKSDPIIKLLRAKPGDIVRISRRSPTAGSSTYYRLVISA
jgi:DNA-directed RNA polymerase subunit H